MTAHFTDEETEPRIQSFRNAKVAGKTIKQDVSGRAWGRRKGWIGGEIGPFLDLVWDLSGEKEPAM